MTQYGYGFNKDGSLLFDLTNYQRDVMAANEEFDRSNFETGLGDRLITEVDYGPPSGVDTEFFPLDYMRNSEPELDKTAINLRTKIDLLKSFVEEVSAVESAGRQAEYLARQSHYADMTWLLAELNGIVAHWAVDDYHHVGLVKLRVQRLVEELKGKIEVVK